MKLISWNVNGLRACLGKGFMDFFEQADADMVCLQETKMQPDQAEILLPGYEQYWNSAVKKGYSGTVIFTRKKPLSVQLGMGIPEHDQEGRLITLEFPDFYLVTVYTPNSQRGLTRLDYRVQWEQDFRQYLTGLQQKKPVVVCGDMNVAHREIDLKNPASNQNNAGFTPQEREQFGLLLEEGFVDSYRHFYPDRTGAYTWWSYMYGARGKNIGWRIDYFLVSQPLVSRLAGAEILSEVMGSDHCPISLELKEE